MPASIPWWGPSAALAVLVSCWLVCLLVGWGHGWPAGLALFLLIETRVMFARAVKDWARTVRKGGL